MRLFLFLISFSADFSEHEVSGKAQSNKIGRFVNMQENPKIPQSFLSTITYCINIHFNTA